MFVAQSGIPMLLACGQTTPLRRILLPLGAGLIVLSSLMRGPAQAETATFLIPASEGYGITDCLVDGVACGQIVADAWCESRAKGPAVAFGLASDITGSIGAPAPQSAPGDVVIACGE